MALLGTIRNRFGWLMMAAIVVAIGAFLFMDVSSAGKGAVGPGGQQEVIVGIVNTDNITQDELQTYTDMTYSNNMQEQGLPLEAARQSAWNRLVRKYLIEYRASLAGLTVTPEEMGSLFAGNPPYISPSVQGAAQFQDPESKQFDKKRVTQQIEFFDNTSEMDYESNERARFIEQRNLWIFFKKAVKHERLFAKYNAMLNNGAYAPDWMTKAEYQRNNETYTFNYVQIPYGSDALGEIEVTDSEVEAYIAEHKMKYAAKSNRASIEYITFDVKPSAKDSADYKQELQTIANNFSTKKTDKENTEFLQVESGINNTVYFTKTELDDPLTVRDSLFSAPVGIVIGPYLSTNTYKVVKLLDRKVIADSVKVNHIMRRIQTNEDLENARVLLDSLKKQIDSGATSFEAAAKENNQDFTAPNGNLGYVKRNAGGQITKMFENYVFFEAESDSVKLIQNYDERTQSFSLHLVKVTDYKYSNVKGVRLGVFTKPIIPSEETTEEIEAEASRFIMDNRQIDKFRAKSSELGKTINKANSLEEHGFNVDGLMPSSTTAKIVSWANRSDKIGQLSSLPYAVTNPNGDYTTQFVVVALVSKTAKGNINLKDPTVTEQVRLLLTKRKKAQKVKDAIGDLRNLQEIANKYSVNVETTRGSIAYNSPSVGTLNEPKLQAVASILEAQEVSNPIEGNEGVYFIQLVAKKPATESKDLATAREQVERKFKSYLNQNWLFGAIENTNIEDNRSSIFE